MLPLYYSEDDSLLIMVDDLLDGVQSVCKIAGWVARLLKQNSRRASYILSWGVREKILVIFHYLPGSLYMHLDCSNVGHMNILTLSSLVISLTVPIIANSTTFPNSVILWMKSRLSRVVLARTLMYVASFEDSPSNTGRSYVGRKNVVRMTTSPSTIKCWVSRTSYLHLIKICSDWQIPHKLCVW